MKRWVLRCDMCGVFHEVTADGDDITVKNFSAIVYEKASDIEDVQLLNNSEDDSETRDT